MNHGKERLAHCLMQTKPVRLVLLDWCLTVCPCLCPYLNQKVFMNASLTKKFHEGTRENKLKSNAIPQLFLNERLWCFCRFCNQSTKTPIKSRHCCLNFKSTGFPSLKNKSAATPCRNPFCR